MTSAEVAKALVMARTGWRRFRIALPLAFGVLAAFLASTFWEYLFDPAKGVHQEYFAQVSQIIPLLLIAVGLEARFFDQLRRGAIERTLILVTVIILCLGEMLAISALTTESLTPWHGYIAFVVTAQAWSVALITLLWALTRTDPKRRRTAERAAEHVS